MASSHGKLLITLVILGLLSAGIADITDMIGEAICAAQCLANFTLSLDEPERSFLSQRPDLTEPHCLTKRSNCSLCLEVCRWPRQNISSCESSCDRLEESRLRTLMNSPVKVHLQTCKDACSFSHLNQRDRAAVVDGLRPALCPLPSSWPDGSTCQSHQRCITDTDCGPGALIKCCRLDACIVEHQLPPPSPPSSSILYRFARGGEPPVLNSPLSSSGYCMRISNDTVFAYGDVPPVPGRPTVRQTAMAPGEQEIYRLELDWPDYYNISGSVGAPEWTSPAVFLVQVRLFRDLEASIFTDQEEFGDEILQEELFSEWRSLVWTTRVGAVLSDLSPGTWYQFRLKAASGRGFGGNGRPSQPIKVMTPPETPRNLTESNSRIYSNKIEIKLQWEPPAHGGIPLKFYRVSWRKKNAPPHVDDSSLGEYEVKVPKTVSSYTLQDLEPSTTYKVEVTAVAVVDGAEWSSPPVMRLIKTAPMPSKEYAPSALNYYHNSKGGSCRCGDSAENRNLIMATFLEEGSLKAHLTIPRHYVTQYFGPSVKDATIFHLYWYPHVCIETQNSKVDLSNAPTMISVYTAALAGIYLKSLRFQCHYKLQIRMAEEPLQMNLKKSLDLCFCTPSCTEVIVRSGSGPTNCSSADVLTPLQPVDVGYRLFFTEANQRRPIASGGAAVSSKSETEPVFPVRSAFTSGSNRPLGFDAIIFWKPHPEMAASAENIGRYPKVFTPFPEARRQSRGYRVIWGPRLVEPIELDMYSNGIDPHLDPEQTESKVVDSKVHNVILRNLEPDTLYIVQVQTIGLHDDSPVNSVFFTTPGLRKYGDIDSAHSLRSSYVGFVHLASLGLFYRGLLFW